MTALSVNVNKIATLRNARGGDVPSLEHLALCCERWGADGITVHPRPDERHIRREDVLTLGKRLSVEFNVEGYPSPQYRALVGAVRPAQATLVPDPPEALTSECGWDAVQSARLLRPVIVALKKWGIRVSVFVDPAPKQIEAVASLGADRVELYTGPYAKAYAAGDKAAVASYVEAAQVATRVGLGVNAGHDLNLDNLGFFLHHVPRVAEVSIGHALITDALIYGLENTIRMYQRIIKEPTNTPIL